MGVELESTYKITEDVTIFSMVSVGDWTFQDNITGRAFDQNQNPIGTPIDLDVNDVKVGNSAQTTARLGFEVRPWKGFKVDYSQRFSDRLYSDLVIQSGLDGTDATSLNPAIELPGYTLSDLGFSYMWDFNEETNESVSFRLNINNLFDEEYIAESATNIAANPGDDTYRGINTRNKVFFGFGTTWNFSVRYNF